MEMRTTWYGVDCSGEGQKGTFKLLKSVMKTSSCFKFVRLLNGEYKALSKPLRSFSHLGVSYLGEKKQSTSSFSVLVKSNVRAETVPL